MQFMPTDHYNAGQIIFEEGYPADGVYLICSGKVKVIKKRGHKESLLALLGEGKIFGEMAFIDERPRSATVIATEDTWCYKHNKDMFFEKIKNLDPKLERAFSDLTEIIRERSKEKLSIDHSMIYPPGNRNADSYVPSRSKKDFLSDVQIQSKIAEQDLFMRTLFFSLVEIAYM